MSTTRAPEEVVEGIRKSETGKVKVAICDVDGILRGKYIHKDKFLSAAESGFGFCNVVFGWDSQDVCYTNTRYTGWHSGYPDAKVRLDLGTCRRVPWDGDVPFFLGEFVTAGGEPLGVCPRQTLRRVLGRAERLGLEPWMGLEYEWFNFKETPGSVNAKGFRDMEPLSPGMFGYSLLRASLNRPFFASLMDDLAAFGVPLEGLHTETGPGVVEAAILGAGSLEAADRAVLFKTAVKEIAYRHGILATFMARWNNRLPGCGCHIHQSLRDGPGGPNLFHDAGDRHQMSATFRSYLAGQMALLPELLPMYAPTVNSYKRLVEGFWAPTKVAWGEDNRTTAFRVIPGGAKSTRLETRVGGADLNPYLAVAAALGSGLWGIEQGLELRDPPVIGSAYALEGAVRLPRDLREATARFRESDRAKELFGEEFVDHFASTREWEWDQYRTAVTDWELRRYFEII